MAQSGPWGNPTCDVILADAGAKKLNVMQEVLAITGAGLKAAKDIVDNAPQVVKAAVSREDAARIKQQLENAGAKVEIR